MAASLSKQKNDEVNPIIPYLMLALGVASLIVAALIFLGWMPLGERANILRSDKNWLEYVAMLGTVIFGIANVRTFVGLNQERDTGLAWARWMSFFTIFIGLAFILSVILPSLAKMPLLNTPEVTPLALQVFNGGVLLIVISVLGIISYYLTELGLFGETLGSILGGHTGNGGVSNAISIRSFLLLMLVGLALAVVSSLVWVTQFPFDAPNIRNPEPIRLIPGILLFVGAFWVYRQVSTSAAEESDELRRAVSLVPDKFVRVQLAKSPSAGAIIGFLAIFMAFTMATDLFLRPTSIGSILTNVSSKGVIAIGVTILMISGEFDLSVGSILGVVAMFFMAAMTTGDPIFGIVMAPLPAAIYAVFIGAILGAINGLILVKTGIPSFIVTLGTMLAYRSITLVAIAGGRILRYRDYYSEFPQVFISPWVILALALLGLLIILYTAVRTLPDLWGRFLQAWNTRTSNGHFGTTQAIVSGLSALVVTLVLVVFGLWLALVAIGNVGGDVVQVGFFDIVNGRWDGQILLGDDGFAFAGMNLFQFDLPSDANFRMAIVWWFIFVLVFHIIMTNTPYGNSVFAVGGNVGAARAQGINVDYVKVYNFILVAVLTGVAAIYETARNPGVDPLKGNQWELEVIAMTVIGGALLTGGYGSILGSLLGALIFGMLQTGLVLVGIESRLFSGTVGVVIIVAVVLNTAVRGKQR